MRILTIGILVGSLATVACNQDRPPAGNGDSLASPPAAGTTFPADDGTPRTASPAAAADTASPTAGAAARPTPAERANAWREVTIPAGTSLPIVLETAVGSDISRPEQPVEAHLTTAIMVDGVTAVPEGSSVTGVVTDAARSGKVKGRAHLAMRFDTLAPRGDEERYRIETTAVDRSAAATKKEDTVKVLAPAVGGALIGRIAGGRKGAAIGAGAGAGAGTALVMGTRGKEVRLGKGAALTLRLVEPIKVRVRHKDTRGLS